MKMWLPGIYTKYLGRQILKMDLPPLVFRDCCCLAEVISALRLKKHFPYHL